MTDEEKKNVYLEFHAKFVRRDIPYTDRETGEQKTFNEVTVPQGTFLPDGRDVGGFTFSPLYVNDSRYREGWVSVPMLKDREVWLRRDAVDAEGNKLLDENGKPEKETVKVMPQQLKDAITESRKAWAAEHAKDRPLQERANAARQTARQPEHDDERVPMGR